MEKTNEDIEIDLVDLFYVIRSRLWVIVLSAVLFATAAGLYSSFLITPMYTSTSQLYILSKTTSITSFTDIQLGSQLTQDYMVMVKSRTVVNQVIKNLNLDMEYDALSSIVTVTNPAQTRILNISCNYPNSEMAKKIVDEFANVSKIRIAEITASDKPTIVDWGYASPYPTSPNIKKYIIIGALAGIFLAAGIVIVLHLMDDTIKDSEDVEKYLGLSTLGLIPLEAGGAKQAQIDKKKRNAKTIKKNRKGK